MASASLCPISRTQSFLLSKSAFKTPLLFPTSSKHVFQTNIVRRVSYTSLQKAFVVVSATSVNKEARTKKQGYLDEAKGFVEEMRYVSMKMHTKDQSKEGERISERKPVAQWELSVDGYLKFLVDSKLVYDELQAIVEKASFPYAELRNTGLERSKQLAQDLEWFEGQGHTIPEPSLPGITYVRYLNELLEKNMHQAFLCHFYNVFFAHPAGGLIVGKKVAEQLTNGKVLEFYKWDSDVKQLLQSVREKLNEVTKGWSREEKDRCLEETEIMFKHSSDIFDLMMP